MKTKYLFLTLLSVLSVFTPLLAQDNIPTVQIEQGELIGSLPYGRHFYVTGSAILPSGDVASSVVVRLYKTKVRHLSRNKKNVKELTDKQKNIYTEKRTNNEFLVEESTWEHYLDKDAENFRVYINKPLRFAVEYIMEISYSRRYDFDFSGEEKNEILDRVVERAQEVFTINGVLTSEETAAYLNSAVLGAMRQQVEASGENFYGFDKSLDANPIINQSSLDILTNEYLNVIGPMKANLGKSQVKLEEAEKDLEEAEDEDDEESAQDDIDKFTKRIRSAKRNIAELETNLESKLDIIKKQLAVVSVDRPAGTTRPTAITELDVIKVGTAIGGGAIFFNPRNSETRESNAIAYTALKFYFLPVDKRIDKPYLTSYPFINRASIMLGVATSGSLEYRGQQLDKPLGLTPVVGISYDVNRYFSLDLAATVFRQPSTSTLSSQKKTRFAPILGFTFDVDAFNRIKSMTGGKGPYNVSPTGD
ncbi:MAG: hypothetical protein ACI85O_003263 [Saprospiraceae bacterium]|jgi:hypothetical protein